MNASRDSEPSILADSVPDTRAASEPDTRGDSEPRTRRELLTAGGAAAIAAALGAVGLSTGVAARNGQPVRAGAKNTATKPTTLTSSKGPGLLARVTGGARVGAVRGVSTFSKGIGVEGQAEAKKGPTIGIAGSTRSPEGKAGVFTAGSGGIGVEARSPDKKGVALRTEGRLQFTERSGSSSVSGGAEFVIPVAGGLTDKSLVLATLQDHFPGVHVESAAVLDAEEGLIVVRLNQAVPEEARVAWFVLD